MQWHRTPGDASVETRSAREKTERRCYPRPSVLRWPDQRFFMARNTTRAGKRMNERASMSVRSTLNTANLRTGVEHAGTLTGGLIAFSPLWAAATLFSIAGDRNVLTLRGGPALFALSWLTIFASVWLILRPRQTKLLFFIAAAMVARYALALPVASNNKTMSLFMNAGILIIAAQAAYTGLRGDALHAVAYERMRVVARGLLAVMYFFGIFHKINTDFLDPRVSCAVALYQPLADGFGLSGSIFGHYLAIWSTFIVETITLVSLYWKRYFAIGLLFGLTFHFIIPISSYSWYMDYSSLVLALYILSVPREISEKFYETCAQWFRRFRLRFGHVGLVVPFALIAGAITVLLVAVEHYLPPQPNALFHLHESMWLMFWAIYGGIAMVVLARIALDHIPWLGPTSARQPLALYLIPLTLFVTCWSPYVGLKTESSIAMFSNLHTEGGVTNHLLFAKPPYLFSYQDDVVEVLESSSPTIQRLIQRKEGMVLFAMKEFLRTHPEAWISYRQAGVVHDRVTVAAFPASEHANWLERHFLLFKPVDFARPKVCSH
jgi:hypothetical protein